MEGEGSSAGGWKWGGDWSKRLTNGVKQMREQVEMAGTAFDGVELSKGLSADTEPPVDYERRARVLEKALQELSAESGNAEKMEKYLQRVDVMDAEIASAQQEFEKREKGLRKSAGAAINKLKAESSSFKQQLSQTEEEAKRLTLNLTDEKNDVVAKNRMLTKTNDELQAKLNAAVTMLRNLRKQQADTSASVQSAKTESSESQKTAREAHQSEPAATTTGSTDRPEEVKSSSQTVGAQTLKDPNPQIGPEESADVAETINSDTEEGGSKSTHNGTEQEQPAEMSSTNEEATKLRSSLEEQSRLNTNLVEKMGALREQLRVMKQALDSSSAENDRLISEMADRDSEVELLRSKLQEAQKEANNRVLMETAKANSLVKRLEKDISLLRVDVARRKEYSSAQKMSSEKATAEIQRLKDAVQEKTSRINELDVDLNKERAQNDDLRSELSSIISSDKDSRRRLENEKNRELTDLTEQVAMLEAEVAELGSASGEVARLDMELDNVRHQLKTARETVESLRMTVQERERDIERLNGEEASRLSELEETKRSHETALQTVKRELLSQSQKVKSLQDALENVEVGQVEVTPPAPETSDLTERVTELEGENAKLEAKLKGVQRELKKLSRKKSVDEGSEPLTSPRDIEVRMSDMQDENKVLKSELARLNILLIDTMRSRDLVGEIMSI